MFFTYRVYGFTCRFFFVPFPVELSHVGFMFFHVASAPPHVRFPSRMSVWLSCMSVPLRRVSVFPLACRFYVLACRFRFVPCPFSLSHVGFMFLHVAAAPPLVRFPSRMSLLRSCVSVPLRHSSSPHSLLPPKTNKQKRASYQPILWLIGNS